MNGGESMVDFLAKRHYIPREVSDREFNSLYEKLSLRKPSVLIKKFGDFEPTETLSIKSVVEESSEDYTSYLLQKLSRVYADL